MPNKGKSSTSIVHVAINLTLACFLAGSAIAAVYAIAEPISIKNRALFEKEAMHSIIPNATSFVKYNNHPRWYIAQVASTTIGYILQIETRGYGGTIKLIVACDTNFSIINYTILSHNETPGLGDKACQQEFRQQFKGKTISQLVVVKTHDPTKIDAISGATITSNAVTKGIRFELLALQQNTNSLYSKE